MGFGLLSEFSTKIEMDRMRQFLDAHYRARPLVEPYSKADGLWRDTWYTVRVANFSREPFVPPPDDIVVSPGTTFAMLKLDLTSSFIMFHFIVSPVGDVLVNGQHHERVHRETIVHENGASKIVHSWDPDDAAGALEADPEVRDPDNGQLLLPQWWDPADIVNRNGTPRYTPPHPGAMLATFLDDLPLDPPLHAGWLAARLPPGRGS